MRFFRAAATPKAKANVEEASNTVISYKDNMLLLTRAL